MIKVKYLDQNTRENELEVSERNQDEQKKADKDQNSFPTAVKCD